MAEIKHGLFKSIEMLIETAKQQHLTPELEQSIADVQTFLDDEGEFINLYGEDAEMGSYDDGHPEE